MHHFAPSSSSSTTTMNNSSDNNISNNHNNNSASFPFNFSSTMDNSHQYCQSISPQGSQVSQGQVVVSVVGNNNNNTNANSVEQQQQASQLHQQAQALQQQQQQLGGTGGNTFNDNLNLVSSLLQGTHHQQQQQHAIPTDVLSGASGVGNMTTNMTWQSCRFCQQKFYVTTDRLLEHEISCPMHLQVQQFLQQQNAMSQVQQQGQGQGGSLGGLEAQLQMQMQQQQQQQQNQFHQQQQGNINSHHPNQNQLVQDSYQSISNSLFGNSNGIGGQHQQQYGNSAGNINMFQSNNNNVVDPQAQAQSQIQGLNNLLQASSNTMQDQSSQYANNQAQASALSGLANPPGRQASNVSSSATGTEDQFESAIDNLPAFEPQPLRASTAGSSTSYFPLAMPEDEEWLTPLHCFVRRYCVEVFVATPEDVAAPCMGKRNPVSVNQVGIRCPYCSPERMGGCDNDRVDVARARENGVVYPSLIGRIYNSSINLLQRHLRSCAFVPREVLSGYEELKSSNARSGASKKYWADSATRLGLLDTPDGIRLDVEAHKAHYLQAEQDAKDGKKCKGGNSRSRGEPDAPPLVLPSDKRNTTAFTFHLMSQMQPCVFTEADRLGRRRGLDVGFAGLACRHCFGVYGSGRFFPSSVKTMADASKTLDVIYRHVMKCKNCPPDIKGGLRNLRDFHDSERSKMPFGNQRAFFVKIWGRLHSGDSVPRPVSKAILPARSVLPARSAATLVTAVPVDTSLNRSNKAPQTTDSLQGLYAMVKRGSNGDQEQNKLTTQAA